MTQVILDTKDSFGNEVRRTTPNNFSLTLSDVSKLSDEEIISLAEEGRLKLGLRYKEENKVDDNRYTSIYEYCP